MTLRTTLAPAITDPGEPGPPTARRPFRRHALIVVLVLAGVALRVCVQLAYRPALLYVDSYRYLGNIGRHTIDGSDPLGYTVFLRGLLHVHDIGIVPAVQHGLGVAMGVALYAMLVRRGVRTWLAALAAAPVLLDAYIVQIEQLVMSDSVFIALLVAAMIALAWRPRPGLVSVVVAGAALGASITVRTVGQPVILLALIYVVITGLPGWRRRLVRGVALLAAFAVPLAGYSVWALSQYDDPGLGSSHGRMLYARAATFADCQGVEMPAYERPLCPTKPVHRRPGVDEFMWGTDSPASAYQPPRGMNKDTVLGDFAVRIYRHQPADFAGAVLTDFLRGFAPAKVDMDNQVPIKRWQFQTSYPVTTGATPAEVTDHFGGHPASVNPGLARFLRGYQLSVGYLPGTVVGLSLLLGLLAAAGVRRRGPPPGTPPVRAICALLTASTLTVLVLASLFEFSWRYQLPGTVIAPAVGALALTAIFPRRPRNARRTEDAARVEPARPEKDGTR
jgi:4-amino-4-deoxy-L-arabinose transferase-like glycosyltransferase